MLSLEGIEADPLALGTSGSIVVALYGIARSRLPSRIPVLLSGIDGPFPSSNSSKDEKVDYSFFSGTIGVGRRV